MFYSFSKYFLICLFLEDLLKKTAWYEGFLSHVKFYLWAISWKMAPKQRQEKTDKKWQYTFSIWHSSIGQLVGFKLSWFIFSSSVKIPGTVWFLIENQIVSLRVWSMYVWKLEVISISHTQALITYPGFLFISRLFWSNQRS